MTTETEEQKKQRLEEEKKKASSLLNSNLTHTFNQSSGLLEKLVDFLKDILKNFLSPEKAEEWAGIIGDTLQQVMPAQLGTTPKDNPTPAPQTPPAAPTAPAPTPAVSRNSTPAQPKPAFASHANTIVCRGDSIAEGLRGHFPGFNVIDLAENGRASKAMTNDDLSKVPQGAIWVLSAGTNQDVQYLMNASPIEIEKTAQRIVALAKQGQQHGALQTCLYDIRQVKPVERKDGQEGTTGYTGGDQSFWGNPNNVRKWNEMAVKLNAAMEAAAAKEGITFLKTDGKVEIGADGLHPSQKGLGDMATTLTKAAGLKS